MLNLNKDFISFTVSFFDEQAYKIEAAIESIISSTLSAINFQCSNNNKSIELARIAKECNMLSINELSLSCKDFIVKGRSANSEIFGINLTQIVDQIATNNNLKRGAVNTLMSIITPALLSTVYNTRINQEDEKLDYGVSQLSLQHQ